MQDITPTTDEMEIDRRTLIAQTGAATGVLALAGCLDGDDDEEDEDEDDPDAENGDENGADEDYGDGRPTIEVEDPPNAVYLPTHREAMRMLDPVEAGDMMLGPMLSYPHDFWTIAGSGEDAVERESPDDGRGVHMMFTLWDQQTGTVLPVDDGVQIRVYDGDEQVGSPVSPWSMISQEMGFHFGDNVTLPEDGTYTVEVTIPPLSVRTTGDLAGRLDERVSATFEFEYDDEFRHEVIGGVQYLDEEQWGDRDALEPMDHGDHGEHGDHDGHDDEDHDHEEEHDHNGDHDGHDEHDDHAHVPYSALPRIEEYGGTILATAGDESGVEGVPTAHDSLPRSDDAAILVALFEDGSADAERLSDDGDGDDGSSSAGQYLLVSPRTPYNRVPLADAALSVTVERDGDTIVGPDTALAETLDSEYGIHYGLVVDDAQIETGDSVTVTIDSPPQIARHQGYDTAFLEMPPIEFTVPEQ
ncbi:hypothetical protein C483_19125 [Natrialba hulunbeirensis JCM 10989]|uniref:DUF7350 domain-containing protein n=1 Tax=Natrialba hulunbeirensis JCM 10989 TaxID=1227493 RepID=L9ZN41_9EURY|nr:hypothetical protein [Natrialba hulunbeirensis]ELY86553.1 hypothetical protein C483_19125 [Natrialba hulunbeirensis JCM 10989]